jgi:uncharacterized protein (DUF952 family)
MQAKTIYKLLTAVEWETAWAEGVYRGSEQDQRDGFIHLSTAAQIAETARKHFSGVPDLVVLAIDIEMLESLHTPHPSPFSSGEGAAASLLPGGEGQDEGQSPLRWEPSRGGDVFPHLYAMLPSAAVQSATPAPLADDGTLIITHNLPS